MDSDRLNKILANLPERTGVYIYRNGAGTVIYVGKATSLKSRVKQYFSASGDGRATVESMVPQIEHIDFVVTANVQEALLLESDGYQTKIALSLLAAFLQARAEGVGP